MFLIIENGYAITGGKITTIFKTQQSFIVIISAVQ